MSYKLICLCFMYRLKYLFLHNNIRTDFLSLFQQIFFLTARRVKLLYLSSLVYLFTCIDHYRSSIGAYIVCTHIRGWFSIFDFYHVQKTLCPAIHIAAVLQPFNIGSISHSACKLRQISSFCFNSDRHQVDTFCVSTMCIHK